ncbi:MAG: adenosylmethionine decarboxylase [Desulfurococcales archaeon ex4484_217_1]|nr:MAG: adenosylmethionine decarboxylase [Desulfurococcales archaeon ex4484_217_1]
MTELVALQRRVSVPKVVGKHVYGELYDCDAELLRNEEMLKDIVIEATRIGNMTLLDVKSWKIGDGVSIVAIVLESHIAVHTWPEFSFATVDVYSCGEHTEPEAAFHYIASSLKARKVIRGYVDRSYRG